FGGLLSSSKDPYRNARIEVRVGDYAFDNANFNTAFGERAGVVSRGLPQEDRVDALRRELWLGLDVAYKGATEQMAAKLSALEGQPPRKLPDLSQVPPLKTEPLDRPRVDEARVQELVASLSARLERWEGIEEAESIARVWSGARMLCSSEGARAWLPTGFAVVRVEGVFRAEDGSRLRGSRSWVAADIDGLPSMEEMFDEVDDLGAWLSDLRDAPIEEDYLGPVLMEGPAAVEMFRQVLLPEISGTPPAMEAPDGFQQNAQPTPTARLGRRLLPGGWRVVDDPTADMRLAGAYDYDFEGVAGERVVLVEDGVARDLLMSRIPRSDVEGTNGHGRSLGVDRRVGMPSVVTVTPKRSKSSRRLEKKATGLARQAGRDYVLVVKRLEPPALAEDFRVAFSGEGPLPGITRPLEAYRLYADGRREPVRGLEFLGVDRRTLRDIAVAGGVTGPINVLDAGPGAQRFSIGAVGGLPATWSAPAVVITEMELRGSGGAEPRVISPPPVSKTND
ncbi:MAG: metallopeptidase TldD-related protein, partial [Myxococcota bacterium]